MIQFKIKMQSKDHSLIHKMKEWRIQMNSNTSLTLLWKG